MAPYSSADLALCFSVDLEVDNESPRGDEAVLASPVVASSSYREPLAWVSQLETLETFLIIIKQVSKSC